MNPDPILFMLATALVLATVVAVAAIRAWASRGAATVPAGPAQARELGAQLAKISSDLESLRDRVAGIEKILKSVE